MPHGKICYLEIPANRAEDSARFYSDIFGWKVRERADGNLAFDDTGSVSGTWVKESDRTPEERTRTYIMVDDNRGARGRTARLPRLAPPAAPANIANTATATSGNEGVPGNESATANTSVGFANLSVIKIAPASANASSPIAYNITVTNSGPNPATGVSLTDALPAGTTFVSLVSPAGWGCVSPAVGSGGTVTCTIASLPLGASPFTLTVNAPVAPGPSTNTATVTSTNEGVPGNESANATTTVIGGADLVTTKTAPPFAQTGTQITYNISVLNAGPDPATNVTLTDTLPAGVTFVSATPSQGSCVGGATVNCNLATLANGATATIALVVNVTAATGATITNSATADSTETDPTPANATATTAAIPVVGPGDIPTASTLTLLLLVLTMGVIAIIKLR